MASVHCMAVVYGDTIFLAGITEILRSLVGVDVVEIKPKEGDTFFTDARPDVVILDAAETSSHQMEQLIDSFPTQACPVFIRLNANEQLLTVHSTQNLPAVNMADLTQVIERICNP